LILSPVWNFITDFGDSAVTAPLALLILGFLFAAGQRWLTFGWMLAIGGCAIVIGVLKVVFGACGHELVLVHLISPSGHTAMSTAVYGSLALLIGARLPSGQRRTVLVAAAVAIVGIALSRVALHDHSRSEIALGFAVGVCAVAVFRAVLRRHAAPALPLGWILLSGGILVVVTHGTRWMIEPAVHRLAWDFRLDLPFCR
jgi:membrane-associated phospholipid phosphatase